MWTMRVDYPTRFVTPALPGVTVHVLGPTLDPAMRKNKKVPSTWGFEDRLSNTPNERKLGASFS